MRVEAENPLTGEVRHTSTAYLTMVAIDDEGRPAPAPPLLSESEIEQRRRREAELRRRNRLSEREQILADRRPSRLPGSSSQFRGFLARRELENGHRNSEPLDEWIDQAPLLPVGAVSRSDRDQRPSRPVARESCEGARPPAAELYPWPTPATRTVPGEKAL